MTFEERKAARRTLNQGKYVEATKKAKFEKRQRQEKERREAFYPHQTEKRIEAAAEQELKNDRETAKQKGQWRSTGFSMAPGHIIRDHGACFKQCQNRGIKCEVPGVIDECCMIRGEYTDFIPFGEMATA